MMHLVRVKDDGVERQEWYLDDDSYRMWRVHRSYGAERIVDENQQLRRRKSEWLGWMFRCGRSDYEMLLKEFPALASRDHDEATKAWDRLAADSGYRKLFVERE